MATRKKSGGRGKHKDKKEESKSLAYKVLGEAQTKELVELNVNDLQDKLEEVMKLESVRVDLREASILDYYTSNFWWAKEQGFTCQQISAFFTLSCMVIDNIKDRQQSLVENLIELKKCLAGIGQEPPVEKSGGLDFFTLDQGKLISDYLQVALFQHYKLFEYIFTHTQAEDIIGLDLDVEVPKAADVPYPAPLDEAVTEEVYQEHIATPPPTPQAELTEDDGSDADIPELSEKEKELLSSLTQDKIVEVLDSVCKELLSGLEAEVIHKLHDVENAFLTRINKIHKIL